MVSHTSDVIPDTFLVDIDKGLHKEVSSKHLISDHNRPTTVSRSSLSYRLLGSNGYWGEMNVKWKPKVDFATCVFMFGNFFIHVRILTFSETNPYRSFSLILSRFGRPSTSKRHLLWNFGLDLRFLIIGKETLAMFV